MSLSGSFLQNLAPRAAAHLHNVRATIPQVEIAARAEIPEHNLSKRSSSEEFADVVARQLPGVAGLGAVAAPVAKRAVKAARPFGKRSSEDDYTGPVELDQDEFTPTPATVVRRQAQSPKPNTPSTNNWLSGDLGYVMARYTNGTVLPVVIGSTVYSILGGEDSCGTDPEKPGECFPLPQLQARLQTIDGSATAAPGSFLAMKDDLSAYGANMFIGMATSQNTGVPYWAQMVSSPAYVWTIDQTTGVLSAFYQNSVLQFAANENRVPYAGSVYSGNGDVDAWPAGQTIDKTHVPIVLYLSKTAA